MPRCAGSATTWRVRVIGRSCWRTPSSPARPRPDSERDISVGGVSKVGLDTFEPASTYAALGHLHGRHTLSETVRYSGSPLAYSFSEARHRKGSWLVDLGPEGLASSHVRRRSGAATSRPGARHVGVAAVRAGLAGVEPSWLHVTLTDARRPRDAMERLRTPLPALPGHRVRARRSGRRDRATPSRAGDGPHRRRGPGELLRRHPRVRAGRRRGGPAAGRRATPAGSPRTSPHEGPPARDHCLRAVPGTEVVDFDALNAAGLFLLDRPDRRRQDQHPRRDLLRPVRRGPR